MCMYVRMCNCVCALYILYGHFMPEWVCMYCTVHHLWSLPPCTRCMRGPCSRPCSLRCWAVTSGWGCGTTLSRTTPPSCSSWPWPTSPPHGRHCSSAQQRRTLRWVRKGQCSSWRPGNGTTYCKVLRCSDMYARRNYHLYINNNPQEQSNIRERKRGGCRWLT